MLTAAELTVRDVPYRWNPSPRPLQVLRLAQWPLLRSYGAPALLRCGCDILANQQSLGLCAGWRAHSEQSIFCNVASRYKLTLHDSIVHHSMRCCCVYWVMTCNAALSPCTLQLGGTVRAHEQNMKHALLMHAGIFHGKDCLCSPTSRCFWSSSIALRLEACASSCLIFHSQSVSV